MSSPQQKSLSLSPQPQQELSSNIPTQSNADTPMYGINQTPMALNPPTNMQTTESMGSTSALGSITKNELALEKFKQIEFLPDLLDLVHEMKNGKITPKDFHNSAGIVRVKIARAKKYLSDIEGLDTTSEERLQEMQQARKKIQHKKDLIKRFRTIIGSRVDLTKSDEKSPETPDSDSKPTTQSVSPDIIMKDE